MTDITAEIVSTMRHPVLVLDGELRVMLANPAFCDEFQISEEQAIGHPLRELGNRWDVPEMNRLLTDLGQGKPEITGYRVEHDFDQIGHRVMLVNARRMELGGETGFLLEVGDITELEWARWELEGEKEFAEKIVDASREALLILDRNLCVKAANETFYRTFGTGGHETVGRLVFELGDNQWDIPRLRELLEDVLPQNNKFDDFEVEHDFKEIGHREMILNARKIDHKQWILLAIEDVTERMRSMQALRASEERLRKVLETETVGVIFFDDAGFLVDANDAFLKMMAYDREEVESGTMHWRDLTPTEWVAIAEKQWEKLDRTGRLGPYEKELLHKGGSRSWMLFAGRDLGDGTSVEYCIDISARKEAEEQRELLLAELNHRVKNTLAVVQGLASQTIARSRSLDEFNEAFTGRLSALARGHSQLLKGEWQAADLGHLVEEAVSAFDPSRVKSCGPPVNISSRAALSLTMVLHELETNSAKYGALSGKDGRVDIVWTRDEDGTVHLTWRESGGPAVTPPDREGFGTRLIRQLVEYDLGGEAELHFEHGGIRAEFTFTAPAFG